MAREEAMTTPGYDYDKDIPAGFYDEIHHDAWIAKVLKAKNACVFFDFRSIDSPLFRAWNDAATAGAVVTQPIEGRRPYGLLSCKA